MAKPIYESQDFRKNKIINAADNPLTTANRITLGNSLTVNDIGISCYDINLLTVFYWNGTAWAQIAPSIISGTRVILTAGETISGSKAVMIDTDTRIYLFDITNPYHYDKYVGVAETSANEGNPVTVITEGKSVLIGSGWLPGKAYYITSDSTLSTTLPPAGTFWKRVGVGIDTDTIMINSFFEVVTI